MNPMRTENSIASSFILSAGMILLLMAYLKLLSRNGIFRVAPFLPPILNFYLIIITTPLIFAVWWIVFFYLIWKPLIPEREPKMDKDNKIAILEGRLESSENAKMIYYNTLLHILESPHKVLKETIAEVYRKHGDNQ